MRAARGGHAKCLRDLTPVAHVQVAVAFRDPYLFQVFELALLANKQLQAESTPDKRLQEQAGPRLCCCVLTGTLQGVTCCRVQAMTLALGCLSYDFIGTCLDESSEDLATIQVLLQCSVPQPLSHACASHAL